MARLPVQGSDDGQWGAILNEFLTVEHNADGTLKIRTDGSVVQTTGDQTIAGVKTFSSSPIVPTPTLDGQAATKLYVDSVAGAGAPDASSSTKGILQLTGDLGGTAASPTVPGLTGKQPLNAHLTAIAGLTPTADDLLQYQSGAWTNRTPAQLKTALSLTKSDVGLANVDNTSDASKPISSATQTALNAKANDNAVVHLTGAETVAGVKTFSSSPVVPAPTNNTDAATKLYVDSAASGKEPTIAAGTTAQYWRGDKTWQTLDKAAVGLSNVDNTSDASKPVSTATQTALNLKANDNAVVHLTGNETVAGIKTFSSSPVVPAPTNNTDAATKLYVDNASSGKEPTITAGTTAQYWRGDKTWQTLNKAAVGLSNVDNTSDASKPVSTATQTQLDAKVPTSRTITAGTGLTGGGDLSANRTLSVSFGTTAGTVAQGNDSRFTDSRTPLAHASSHASNGSDPITPLSIGALPISQTFTSAPSGVLWTVNHNYGTAQVSDPNVYEVYQNGTLVSWMNEWGGLRFRIPSTSAFDAGIRIIAASNQSGPLFEIEDSTRTQDWLQISSTGELLANRGITANTTTVTGNSSVGGNLTVTGNLSVSGTYPGNVIVSSSAPSSPVVGTVWIDTSP